MPKTRTKNPNLIIKILSDLNLLPEKGEDVNEKSYLRALMEGVNILSIEALSRPGRSDPRVKILQDEVKRVRADRKAADKNFKAKKTTIKGGKFFGNNTFHSEDIKPVDIDPESKQDDSSALVPKRLDGIANSVESIATLLRRQLGLQKKQQRDARVKQDKINKQDREDDLEKKPDDKKKGLIPDAIKKPALNFFERIKNFFLNIVIGAGVVKLFDWLKDPANAEKVEKFSNFLINNAGWILGGLAALALLPVLSSIMGVLGALKGGLLLLKPALGLLFSPAGLAALALAAGLGGTLLAMKFLFDKGRDFATGGKNFTAKHKSLDERLKEAGMNRAGVVGKETKRGFRKTGTRNAEQEKLFQEVEVERERLNNLHTAMDNEVKYKVAITPHDVPARKQGRQKYASKVSKEKQKEIRTKVEAKYNKMIETGGVAPKEFLTKESTNLLIEKHKKTGETFSSSEDKTSATIDKDIKSNTTTIDKDIKSNITSDGQTSATIDKNITSDGQTSATIDDSLKKETIVPGPSNKNRGGQTVVMPGGGGQQQSGGGGGGSSSSSGTPNFASVDVQNKQTIATQMQYNKVTVDV